MRTRNLASQIIAMAVILGLATSVLAEEPGERIGVYDSRAIVSAYIGSKYFNVFMGDLRRQHNQAKAEGDTDRVAELEAQGVKHQRQIHRMGFSTAPVDELLKNIEDKMPAIAKEHGVGPIISKWDKAALAKHGTAEQVDVTMALVLAFDPSEKQIEQAKSIQEHEPVPLETFDTDDGTCK